MRDTKRSHLRWGNACINVKLWSTGMRDLSYILADKVLDHD